MKNHITRFHSFIVMLFGLCLSLSILPGCGGGGGTSVVPLQPENNELSQIISEIAKSGAEWQAAENNVTQMSAAQRKTLDGLIPEVTESPRIAMRNALSSSQLPTALDWRNKDGYGWITPVKDQKSCGSCVAFASLGVVEALSKINDINPVKEVDLSESDLFSCGGASCSNGWYMNAAANRLMTSGVVDEACLPYQDQDNVCTGKCSNWQSRLTMIDSWVAISTDITTIKNYLLQGPVVAGIAVYTDFYYYKSGIYRHVYGSLDGYHAVVIVGYNDQGGYWIVKNSWSSNWGNAGYVYIKYGEVEIENRVLSMQMTGNPAAVVASVDQTSVTLSGGQAQVTLSCSANGSVSTVEGKCDTSDTWATISPNNTRTCTYTSASTYTPACRVNGVISDNIDSPVTVNTPSSVTVTASISPTSGNTTATFTVTCSVSGGIATSLEYRCDATGAPWQLITSGHTGECRYATPGSYTTGCRVNSSYVNNASTPALVSAYVNQAPVASASADVTTGSTPLSIQFTGGCTDSDGTCASYLWDFGDGSPTSNLQNPNHTYTVGGVYSATLVVSDDIGATGQNIVTITAVGNQSPVSSISTDVTSGDAPLTVTFTGGCTDSDGTCISYLWDFDDGSPTNSQLNTSHTFTSDGVYTVTLTVTDNQGADSVATVLVGVGDVNPWITIPAGDFIMGCVPADGLNCAPIDAPMHTVSLSLYKMHKFEVTNAQYKACVDAGVCALPYETAGGYASGYGDPAYHNYPVADVTWNDATTYCSWIGGRLPTEAEWEKAARGPYPSQNVYPWGDSVPSCTLANANEGTTGTSCNGRTTAVGSYPMGASYYDIMDMAGNVMEWVNDWFDGTYYETGGPPWIDPQGPVSGDYHVQRSSSYQGGGSTTVNSYSRTAHRGTQMESNSAIIGFRCAQD